MTTFSMGLLDQQLANHSELVLHNATPMVQVEKAFHKVIKSCMGNGDGSPTQLERH